MMTDDRLPIVSVLMPVYNCERYIDEALDSLQLQTMKDWELIVVDDASTDRTVARLEKRKDPRVRIVRRHQNGGVAKALQGGLKYLRGPYTARMDGDDVCSKERFRLQVDALEANPDWSMARSYVSLFTDSQEVALSSWYKIKKAIAEPRYNRPLTPEQLSETLWWYQCVNQGSIMIRTNVLKHFGYEPLKIAEDYKLFYEMNRAGHKIGTVQKVLYYYRVLANSASKANQPRQMEVVYKYIKRPEILKLFSYQEPVYIWGTGGQGKVLLEYLKQDGLMIHGFIDYKPNSEKQLGYDVFTAKDFLRKGRSEGKVLIAAQPVMNKIIVDLKNHGFKNLEDFVVFV